MKKLLPLMLAGLLALAGLAEPEYRPLDKLGRAVEASAVLDVSDLDPSVRGDIEGLTPTGFVQAEYACIPGGYLYNRCHLIAARLARGTEVAENLVTGTRQLNEAMIAFENRVADFLIDGSGRVLYRVTPDFRGVERVCRGLWLSANSIESDAIRVNGYLENVQDGVVIDYQSGESREDPNAEAAAAYVVNTRKHRFHRPDCRGAADIAPHNRVEYIGRRGTLIADGYRPCGECRP